MSTEIRSLFGMHAGLKARNEPMDKNEAERLASAIRMVQMDWIKVSAVAYNATTDQYEVQCEYQQAGQVQIAFQRIFDNTSDQKPPEVGSRY